jgi:hypothetical protein
MITTSMLGPWSVNRNKPIDLINLSRPSQRRSPIDGTGIVLGAMVGALMSGIVALVVLAAWRYWG